MKKYLILVLTLLLFADSSLAQIRISAIKVDDWVKKVKECITELEQLSFPPLPEVEDGIAVIEGDGTPSGYTIMKTNRDLWSLGEKVWCLHYELLGLVYGMYVELGEFCKQHGFGDAIETIVKGMTPLVLECTEKLKELAKYSIELGLQELFRKYRGEELLKQLEKNINGKKWLEMFDAVKYPYFLACEAQSLYFDERAWIDDLDTLFYNINGYITKLERGESIEREIDELIKERDSKTQECYNMLKTDADREAFNNLLNTVRKIYPFSEDHNFYVEFWSFGLVRNTVRKLGAWLVHHGVLDSADDIMFFKRYEIEEVLFDVCQAWGSGIGMMFKSPSKWRKKVAETRKMYDAFIKWTPPDILGSFPEKITEPFTIMLWGITDEKLAEWKNDIEQSTEINKAQEIHEIQGIAGSPGVVEGPAKVITRFSESTQVKEGDILVTFTIAPAWGPILNRVKAVVLDAGGKMCHGAIVAREERVPAVVGSRVAMNIIKTGDIIRVDGNKGIVTILKRME